MIIAIAGPTVNIIVIGAIQMYSILTKNTEILNIEIEKIIYANLLIFIFNILPIYPLDGGRILKEVIHIFNGIISAYKAIHILTNVTIILLTAGSSLLVLKYHNIAIVVIIAYLWTLVIKENKEYEVKYKLLEQYILKKYYNY